VSSPTAGPSAGLPPVTRFLVLAVAAIGFLFDTYELLMFPVTGAAAISELLNVPVESDQIRLWSGRMLWIAALSGGVFGLLGGWMIDRLGRKTVMVGSILLYSLSPVAAALSTDLWMLILFRCTTFIGVCVEAVAAVTWLAELFSEKRSRELAIGWTLAFASLGGIAVTEVYNGIVEVLKHDPTAFPRLPVPDGFNGHAAWRYTLLTGLIPGALILLLMPFVPESRVWADRKRAGTLRRPSFGELFTPGLLRTTLVTTGLSACAYAAAFGALQLGPLVMVPGLPAIDAVKKEAPERVNEAEAKVKTTQPGTPERKSAEEELNRARGMVAQAIKEKRGNIQRWQEIGGLTGRILLAALLVLIPSRLLIKLFILPAIVMYPLTYLRLFEAEYTAFATAVFFCGLLTVAQFSFISEYLPKVFPVHLRGTGGGFATNFGGRMLGTMAALLNTEILAPLFEGDNPTKVATAAAVIGGSVYAFALVLSFLMPAPKTDE
jgi:MFS family permease